MFPVAAGDGLGGEAGQRGQQVVQGLAAGDRRGPTLPAVEQRVDEPAPEQLAAGALGRRLGQVGVAVQLRQQPGVHLAAGGALAVDVVALLAPRGGAGDGVQSTCCRGRCRRRPARPARPPTRVTLAMPPMFWMARRRAGRAQQEVIDQWHQRRALAAGGHVAGAEVGDHRQSGALGDDRRLADLQGRAQVALRAGAVGGGLSVRGDEVHRRTTPRRPGCTRPGRPRRSTRRSARPARTARWRRPRPGRRSARAAPGGRGGCGSRAASPGWPRPHPAISTQGGVHAVGAGAGHQPDDQAGGQRRAAGPAAVRRGIGVTRPPCVTAHSRSSRSPTIARSDPRCCDQQLLGPRGGHAGVVHDQGDLGPAAGLLQQRQRLLLVQAGQAGGRCAPPGPTAWRWWGGRRPSAHRRSCPAARRRWWRWC